MFAILHGAAVQKFIWDAMPAYVEGKKVMCDELLW